MLYIFYFPLLLKSSKAIPLFLYYFIIPYNILGSLYIKKHSWPNLGYIYIMQIKTCLSSNHGISGRTHYIKECPAYFNHTLLIFYINRHNFILHITLFHNPPQFNMPHMSDDMIGQIFVRHSSDTNKAEKLMKYLVNKCQN